LSPLSSVIRNGSKHLPNGTRRTSNEKQKRHFPRSTETATGRKEVRCCTKQVRSKDHLLKRNHKYEDHDVVVFSLPPCPCCALLTDEEIRASITISITITSYLTCQSDSTIAPSMRSGCLMDYVRW